MADIVVSSGSTYDITGTVKDSVTVERGGILTTGQGCDFQGDKLYLEAGSRLEVAPGFVHLASSTITVSLHKALGGDQAIISSYTNFDANELTLIVPAQKGNHGFYRLADEADPEGSFNISLRTETSSSTIGTLKNLESSVSRSGYTYSLVMNDYNELFLKVVYEGMGENDEVPGKYSPADKTYSDKYILVELRDDQISVVVNGSFTYYHYQVGKELYVNKEGILVVDDFTPGKHTIAVYGVSNSRRYSVGRVTVNIADTAAPDKVKSVKVAMNEAKYYATFSWDASSDNSGKKVYYEFILDGEIYKTTRTSIKISKLGIGDHIYSVRAYDAAGNYSAWTAGETIVVKDITAPTVQKVKATANGYELNFAVTSKDNDVVTEYRVTDIYGNTQTFDSANFKLAVGGPGKQTFYVVAIDASGNESKAKKYTINVKDVVAPETMSVDSFIESWNATKGRISISWDGASDDSGTVAYYQVEFNGKVYKTSRNYIDITLKGSSYEYRIRAVDKAGNKGEWSDMVADDFAAPSSTFSLGIEESSFADRGLAFDYNLDPIYGLMSTASNTDLLADVDESLLSAMLA